MNVSVAPQLSDMSDTTTNLTVGNETELLNNNGTGFDTGASKTMRIVYVAIGAIGTIGNVNVLIVMLSLKYLCSKTTNKFIIHQSFIDLLSSLAIIMTYLIDIIPVSSNGVVAHFVCVVVQSHFLVWALVSTSTYNLIAMTLEKYIAVVYPFKHKRIFTKGKTKVILGLVWLIGPSFFSALAISTTYRDGECGVYATFRTRLLIQNIYSYCNFVIMWYIPLIIMAVCYGRMAWFLHTNTNLNVGAASDLRRLNLIQARRNTIKTLILVALLNVICTSPKQIFDFLFLSGVPLSLQGDFYNFAAAAVFSNCAVNPLLYSIQFQDFKKGVVRLICCKPGMQTA
ncbi:unnamed protein product [Owenia fusiformis]|uniref:Uncharacterized protein n=1 Tax=Owenia fusiformis TaxID=6347 RepID=A0A8J1TUL6_OWEFU|nr:unnamed protein product [Owenia fusiformis]